MYGQKRINMSLVRDYKPFDKDTHTGIQFQIKFTLVTGEEEILHFFDREKDRNNYLKYLDENLLPLAS